MNRNVVFLILSISLAACDDASQTAEFDDSIYDYNGDGVLDVKVSYDDDETSYELVDRNFDARVDESHHYNKKGLILGSKIDDNFDGILETKIIYQNHIIKNVLTDIDNDSYIDIIYFYDNATLINAEKFQKTDNKNHKSEISRVEFSFGYPVTNETTIETDLTRKKWLQQHGINNDRVWQPNKK